MSKQYLELDERPESTSLQNYLANGNKKSRTGVETRIYGDIDRDSSGSFEHDDSSRKQIMGKKSMDGFRVNVHKDFKVEVSRRGKALPKTPIPGDSV